MGHGARSALVTAILRALVRTHSDAASDPGRFLTELNSHLHEVIARSEQTLFVTAFFLVLDTANGRASWAVAGHPAPLRVNRHSDDSPEPLWTKSPHQPALGLISNASFRTSESSLAVGDVFLLFTDGAIEAENPEGEYFGDDRLATTFDRALQGSILTVPEKIVEEVNKFQGCTRYEDDVCLLVVEAAGNQVSSGARVKREEATVEVEP